jgi:hypothetical protein
MSIVNENHIYGLTRSGNHAIIFWILHNLAKHYVEISEQCFASDDHSICYLNNVGILKHNNVDTSIYKTLFKSWEDIPCVDNQNTLVITRDFINLIASKYKAYDLFLTPILFSKEDIDKFNIVKNDRTQLIWDAFFEKKLEYIISVWKQHHSAKNVIKYNDWLISRSYRNAIAQDLGISNANERMDYTCGFASSSFGIKTKDPQQYLSRYTQIKFPSLFIDHILNDTTLVKMNKEIYNIDLQEILSYNTNK